MSIEEEYIENYEKFKDLIQSGFELSEAIEGIELETRKLMVGSRLFMKLIAHARAIFVLLPQAPAGENQKKQLELWDISSVAVLARSLVEAYYTLYYVGIDNPGEKANEFRWLVWDFHAEMRRNKQFNLMSLKNPEISNIEQLKQQIINHEEYKKLDSARQKDIIKAKDAILLTNSELSCLAGIDEKLYKIIFMFLSSYTHSHPFSVEQLMSFRAGEKNSLHLIDTIIKYSSLYLSLAIRDFMGVLPMPIEIGKKHREL